jgi:antibiotic biosynthesis monooxygenase (ABM) superfamily enzyme
MNAALPNRPVTIIVQTRVRSGENEAFGRWQARIGEAASEQPGFLEQSILPPNPPVQTDWVILQRFADTQAAVAWMNSDRRLTLLTEGQPLLVGVDDVHLVTDADAGALPSPVSAVFSTRLKPGGEPAFRVWQQRVAVAQTHAPGFQGYRFEPPIPGVQDDWVAILRFDNEENLQRWLDSPARLALLKETDAFTAEFRTRVVRTGFEQWFQREASGQTPQAAWKQNMIVVGLLYPVVFLFGLYVQAPILMRWMGLPFWASLFIGNVVSVLLLNELVPRVGGRLRWWLNPAAVRHVRADLLGACMMLGLYAVCLLVFSRLG